jgi:hypothetical protein
VSLSPHWIDAVLVLTLLEGAALALWFRRAGGRAGPGRSPRDFWLAWMSGLCLMAALRGAVAGWGAAWILGWLSASGALHALDLRRRWHRL